MSQYQLNMNAVMDAVKTSAATVPGFGDGPKINYVKLQDGVNTLRLLPLPAGSAIKRDTPWFMVAKHWGIMGPKGKVGAVACAMESHGKCPICQMSDELSARRDNEERSRGLEIRPQPRFIYTVLSDKSEIGILDLDQKAHNAILQAISTYKRLSKDDNFNPFDPATGRWFEIVKGKDPASLRQKFPRNTFTAQVHHQPSSIPPTIMNRYAETFVYPEKITTIYTPEELAKILRGDWGFLGDKFGKNGDTSFDPQKLERETMTTPYVSPSSPVMTPPLAAVSKVVPSPLPKVQNSIDDELKDLIGDM